MHFLRRTGMPYILGSHRLCLKMSGCCGGRESGNCCGSSRCPPKEPYESDSEDVWASDDDFGYSKSVPPDVLQSVSLHGSNESHINVTLSKDLQDDPHESHMHSTGDSHYGKFVPPGTDSVETAALRRRFGKQGYVDGKSQWQELGLQQGFDSGYPIGARLGLDCGRLLGKLMLSGDAAAVDQCAADMAIQEVLKAPYFVLGEAGARLSEGQHPVVAKWESLGLNYEKTSQ